MCAWYNLCAKIPDGVSDDAAAFTVIGAVGLQGVRLLEPAFGETVVVIGLGLIGLIAAQLKYIVSAGGLSAGTLAKRAGFACAATRL